MVADLYKLYQEYDGQLSSKHTMSNLSHYYGEQLMILRLDGCANVIGFRRFISMSMKRVAQRDDAQEDEKIEAIALKLHYKFGSAEIVRLTHEHGLSDGR